MQLGVQISKEEVGYILYRIDYLTVEMEELIHYMNNESRVSNPLFYKKVKSINKELRNLGEKDIDINNVKNIEELNLVYK